MSGSGPYARPGVPGLRVAAASWAGILCGALGAWPPGVPDPHLDQSPADAGLPEQKDIIAAVVELLGAVSGRPRLLPLPPLVDIVPHFC